MADIGQLAPFACREPARPRAAVRTHDARFSRLAAFPSPRRRFCARRRSPLRSGCRHRLCASPGARCRTHGWRWAQERSQEGSASPTASRCVDRSPSSPRAKNPRLRALRAISSAASAPTPCSAPWPDRAAAHSRASSRRDGRRSCFPAWLPRQWCLLRCVCSVVRPAMRRSSHSAKRGAALLSWRASWPAFRVNRLRSARSRRCFLAARSIRRFWSRPEWALGRPARSR